MKETIKKNNDIAILNAQSSRCPADIKNSRICLKTLETLIIKASKEKSIAKKSTALKKGKHRPSQTRTLPSEKKRQARS